MYQEGVTEGIPIRVTHLGRVQLCPGVLATGHLQFRLLARHLGTPALGGPCHGPFTCLAPFGPPIQHRGRRGGRWAGTPPPGASACSAGRGQLHPGGSRPALSQAGPPCCASAGPRQHGSPGPELADESASRGDCPGDAPRSSVDKGWEKHGRAARPAPGVRCSSAGCGEQRRAGPEVQGSGHTADGQWPQ